ncbi:hypothetical protein ACRQ5Q_14535 [Bradyrhizobium sp. PMVTL-01]|uniref:TSCPD domain-containing protein n=1 Tax=Bradyrhizobium sp. PMVTL-01 TaxID=3434999 RepID=UPI003F709E99
MRTKLPDRRQSETRKMTIVHAGGTETKILITIGFDDEGVAKEVFCADFKAGSDLHALVMDACILISRCLQYGDTVAELAEAMCKGPSVIGAILTEIANSSGVVIRWRGGESDGFAPFPKNPTSPSGAPQAAAMA